MYSKRWSIIIALTLCFVIIIARMDWWEIVLRFLFPLQPEVLHPRADLMTLVGEHLILVVISSGLTILIGVIVGIWVTRPGGRSFLPLVNNLTSISQTFPPVAVIALAVPLLGFGAMPTIAALFLYGLLPIVRNTIAGIDSIPVHILDAAYGMGMNRMHTLVKVEIPMSARIIVAGIRISVIINIGTAMIGAVIGAGGLGSPVIAGLVRDNAAYILEGVIPAAFLAVIADQILAGVNDLFAHRPASV